MMASKTRSHRDHLRRPWRVAFVIYALALTIGTHWPQLELSPAVPATDTDLHFIAFGLLTFLLARSGWIRQWWLIALVGALWGAADEMSQAIGVLNRTISWRDGASNALGAISVGALLWAARPRGGSASALPRYAFDRAFLRWRTWTVLAILLILCAIAPAFSWFLLDPETTSLFIILAAFCAAVIGTLLTAIIWRREQKETAEKRICFACGMHCAATAFDAAGFARCPHCNETVRLTQWIIPRAPSTRMVMTRKVLPRIAAAYAAMLLIFAGLSVIESRAASLRGTAAAESAWGELIQSIASLPSGRYAVAMIFVAIALRICSRRMEEIHRLMLCPRCGHDLRAGPSSAGIRRCGQCGEIAIVAS